MLVKHMRKFTTRCRGNNYYFTSLYTAKRWLKKKNIDASEKGIIPVEWDDDEGTYFHCNADTFLTRIDRGVYAL